jgi:hypothetical protein
MADEQYQMQPALDAATKIRNIEEQQRLIRDRVLLLGQSMIDERNKTFKDIQEMKSSLIKLKEDVQRLKELMQRMSEQISIMARKEELMIIQRQLDLVRKE